MRRPQARRRPHRLARLHVRIWFAVLASLLVFALLTAAAWRLWFAGEAREWRRDADVLAIQLAQDLLPMGAGVQAWQATLARWQARTGAELSLRGPDGRLLAGSDDTSRRWVLRLDDGRELAIGGPWRNAFPGRPAGPGFALTLLALVLAIGIGIYPVARRLTRRLERLRVRVDELGEGQLSARVEVRGHDEVAALAMSFNRSAERIESLVRAQRDLLANASHELRSPLARIRMAVELIGDAGDAATSAEIRRNVAELDTLVEELLLASRLQAVAAQGVPAPARLEVDLAAVLAEECARLDLPWDGLSHATVIGDERLLRRLTRNLLENAIRHGGRVGGSAPSGATSSRPGICATLALAGDRVVLAVCDRGPGVAEQERERIFEPFYRARGASERDGGVGLGLALVRRIADVHGGAVRCLAREGGGSRFEVTLPATGEPGPG